jgi:predicted amidohydrolase
VTIRLALAQITGTPYEADLNRTRTIRAADEAFVKGADLVLLPELIIPGYVSDPAGLASIAETIDGPTVDAWRSLAARHAGWVAGGFAEVDNGRLYNSAVLVGSDGVLIHYRKLHLFAGEREVFSPGDLGLPTVDLPWGRVGLCVCYDLRFPEVVRGLALRGCRVVLVPTAWVTGFDVERRDPEGFAPQARAAAVQANLSQVFVACASQVGDTGHADLLGSSILVDPRGQSLIGPLGDAEETAAADIDPSAADRAQQRGSGINPRENRRTDVYRLWLEGEEL